MKARRGLLWLLAGLALALLVGRWVAGLYGDWAFHHALGADALWRERLLDLTMLRAAVSSVAFAFAFAHFFAVRQSIVALVLPRSIGGVEIAEAIPTRRLTLLALVGALLVAALFAVSEQEWTLLAQAMHGLPFAEYEPYLDRDLGFFVNWLPFERHLYENASVLLVITGMTVLLAYVVTPSVRWDERGLYVSTWVRRHLGVLAGLSIAVIAWGWRLDRFALLSAGSGEGTVLFDARPFTAFDHRILLPYLAVISFVALPVAVIFVWSVWRANMRLAWGVLVAVFVAGPVARVVILPAAAPARGDTRAAAERSRPYEATRLLFTRRAFGVDQVAVPDTLPPERLDDAQLARWVSSWDPAALMRFIERDRRGADVAALSWQAGAMGLDAVLLRRAPTDAPPGAAWPADLVRSNAIDPSGLPLPGVGPASPGIGGVLVFPGAPSYALVADTLGRLAAPPFETGLQRLVQAWDQQNPRLLAQDAPSPRPRIVTERDAIDRLVRLTPFLARGETVTPVVRGDSLYWVVELFTVAEHYPLTERLLVDGRFVHYAQHAATAVVQAQTGRVMLLPVAAPDPVMRGWMARLPTLFTAREDAPGWLRSGLPPATDWTMIQGAILGRTGVRGAVLTGGSLSRVDDADADLTAGPPTLHQLDSSGTLGWGIAVSSADRMAGLLVSRGGLAPRTTLLPPTSETNWTGVLQALQRAADQAGFGRALKDSRRGRVQAIPTVGGIAFVQSFYEWPADGPPRLAGVVVLKGSSTVVGRTVAAALGQSVEPTGRDVPPEVFRARAAQLYDAAAAALRVGDWRAYGEAWTALGRLLGRPQR
ncbi:MAG: UPF0182 family protein [Gemmatimonadetes bacterium]|nr:UPF0182 family protein [Gemmatimonadota bacterium]